MWFKGLVLILALIFFVIEVVKIVQDIKKARDKKRVATNNDGSKEVNKKTSDE
jgi:hypothetical protein